jgi:hypothetical protein
LTSPIIAAGKIAFLGVVVGLLGNAGVQWLDRWAKRRHDRKVLCSALTAELSLLHDSYETRIEMMREKGGFYVPTISATSVYEKMLDKIGLLTPKRGRKVIHAYLTDRHLIPRLRLQETRGVPGTGVVASSPTADFIRVSPENMDRAIEAHRTRMVTMKAAIDALKE